MIDNRRINYIKMNSTMATTEMTDVLSNFTIQDTENGNETFHHRTPPDLSDHQSYDSVVRFIRTIVIPTFCIVGFLGNVLNLVVLTRLRYRKAEGRKESATHLGLIVLAISDMLFCIVLFPRGFVPDSSAWFTEKDFWLYYHVYQSGLVTTFVLISTWITVIMALMRYFGICHPFSSRKLDGPLCSKIAYFAVYGICILFNLPIFWSYQVMTFEVDGDEDYLVDIGYFNKERMQIFTIFKLIFGIIVPAILMAFCNLSLIRALRKSYQMRRECHVQENASRQSNRITLTLVVIIITFIVLVFPCELMNISGDFSKGTNSKDTEIFILIRAFANMLEVINFAFNFVLYCTINVNFRSVLKEVITCQSCRGPNNKRMMRQISSRTSSTNVPYATRNGHSGLRLSRYESVAV